MDVSQGGDRTDWSELGPTLDSIKRSVLLQLAVAGGLLIVLAAGMQVALVDSESPGLAGVWAGMLPIWGTALVIVGLGSYAYVWTKRS